MKLMRFAAGPQEYEEDFVDHCRKDFVSTVKDGLPIIYEPPFIKPDIRLVPFENKNMNLVIAERQISEELGQLRGLLGSNHVFFPRAIQAIFALLKYLNIKSDDEIAIIKTYDNDYISRCVTEPIEALCKWSRRISDRSRAILVIHEFGFPCSQVLDLKKEADSRGIPLIEDCAWTMGSKYKGKLLGSIGHYSFFSLPKIFPMQYGAILSGRGLYNKGLKTLGGAIEIEKIDQIKRCLSRFIPELREANEKRRENWKYLAFLLEKIGFHPFNDLQDEVYPACLMVQTDDYEKWNERLESFSVETGKYYPEGAIYLPIHQNLDKVHLDYIFAVINGLYN